MEEVGTSGYLARQHFSLDSRGCLAFDVAQIISQFRTNRRSRY